MNLFQAISAKDLVCFYAEIYRTTLRLCFKDINLLVTSVSQMQTGYMRKKKAEEYFGYIEPISQSYQVNLSSVFI